MELQEAITLISGQPACRPSAGTWADIGCGSGLFTFALAHLLPAGSSIYAIDKMPVKLGPHPDPQRIPIITQQLDIEKKDPDIKGLQGIMMANSLHYVADKATLLQRLTRLLPPSGQFIIVEYDTSAANPWVPFPVRFEALKHLFRLAGWTQTEKLGERPSRYRSGNMYAALISA
ncbi:class I SAM-dependent methyltransferase [Chitinophaga sp. Mgbs1]|uniref:Class I SAM-dependent methyltransferase n=1 Tax=Chitinophaga solisilvae TaxID=1233460 RepID=A0A3S1CXX6_9BACT|nr:class I SAM-dependent methyltransferase [Chitinophaga solisilvae]